MCTVVCRRVEGEPLRILALRDEFVGRDFDEPSTWWPDQPTVVGGRDRTAGGGWCVSDVATGRTALLVNRAERLTGTPTRGLLPLASVAHGDAWTEHVDHHDMASFNLVLAGPSGVDVGRRRTAAARPDARYAPGHVVRRGRRRRGKRPVRLEPAHRTMAGRRHRLQ